MTGSMTGPMTGPEEEAAAVGEWWNSIITSNNQIEEMNKKILLEMENTNPASVFKENKSYRLNNRGRAIKVEEVYPNGWIRATYVQGGPLGEMIYFNARTIDQFEIL